MRHPNSDLAPGSGFMSYKIQIYKQVTFVYIPEYSVDKNLYR